MQRDVATLFEAVKNSPLPVLAKQFGDLAPYEAALTGLVSRQLAGERIGRDEYPSRPDGEISALVRELAWAQGLSDDEIEFMDYLGLLEELHQASQAASEAGITPKALPSPPFDYTADQIIYISNPANYCSSEAADLSRAVINLGASGDRRAVMPIIGLLGISLPFAGFGPDGEWNLSASVFQALEQLGELAIDALVEVLVTEAGGRQGAAAGVLRASPAVRQNDHVVDLLTPALKTSNGFIRASIAWILMEVGTPRATSCLIGLLGDTDDEVRCAAAMAVRNGGFEAALPALLGTIRHDSHSMVRVYAVQAIVAINDKQVIPALVEMCSDFQGNPFLLDKVRWAIDRLKASPVRR